VRYKVQNLEIRSENTAKPIVQASQYLKRWIKSQKVFDNVLDFGCGKLRYSKTLALRARKLTLVDSKIQLDRIQKIDGEKTTIYDYVDSHIKHARVLTFDEFQQDFQKYDLELCAFVLSSIPNVRARNRVLKSLCEKLQSSGRCLFVSQFKDHYYEKISKLPYSKPFLDGWLRVTPVGNFYYGLIDRGKLERIVIKTGFNIEKSWIVKGKYSYLLAMK
jgi:2-polyprenyl-3-methyl-5-hydroxy-6-metoxy-1,4-benzoquinol methylase